VAARCGNFPYRPSRHGGAVMAPGRLGAAGSIAARDFSAAVVFARTRRGRSV
jgi:hypothetical protein